MVGRGCAKGTQALPGFEYPLWKTTQTHTHSKHAETKAQAAPHIRAAAKALRVRFELNSCCIQHSTSRVLCFFDSLLASLIVCCSGQILATMDAHMSTSLSPCFVFHLRAHLSLFRQHGLHIYLRGRRRCGGRPYLL
jgi:hypothetical protein